jgi:hypothetical protein
MAIEDRDARLEQRIWALENQVGMLQSQINTHNKVFFCVIVFLLAVAYKASSQG